jgi:hypothetical protein
MTSRQISVRAIFDEGGELIRILYKNGGSKTYFMDCEPSNDASIDAFLMELMPPQTEELPVPPVAPLVQLI